MVVIIDKNNAPLMWRLGRIKEVSPGDDGTVRITKVLTSNGFITQPVVKLVPLPVDGQLRIDCVRSTCHFLLF